MTKHADFWSTINNVIDIDSVSSQQKHQITQLIEASPWAKQLIQNHPFYLLKWQAGDWNTHLVLQDIETASYDEHTELSRLRKIRNQFLLHIAYRDINELDDILIIDQSLSNLAEYLCQSALKSAFSIVIKDNPNVPETIENAIYLIAMGKLGGKELNFSSDIDLIIGYDEQLLQNIPSIDYNLFFHKVARKFVHLLHANTSEGFVYRVDLRLRPFGSSGPIILSTMSMVNYYYQYGRDWERYAFIKARPIAGNLKIGNDFLNQINAFIYRKSKDYTLIDALKSIKVMIQKEIIANNNVGNIKLGDGGIREIEFIVQSFQLIYGGQLKKLQSTELVPTLHLLQDKFLSKDIVQSLCEAYCFYRKIENRLQLVHDTQTHNLPNTVEEQKRLLATMGFTDWSSFINKMMIYQTIVHEQFENIFGVLNYQDNDNEFTSLLRFFNQPREAVDFKRWLDQEEITDSEQNSYLLWNFQKNTFLTLSENQQKEIVFILLHAFHYLQKKEETNAQTVNLFLDILSSIGEYSDYISWLFHHNPALLLILELCCNAPWLSRYLARHPMLFSELMNSYEDIKTLNLKQLPKLLNISLENAKSEADKLNQLRSFLHTNILKIAMADFSGKMPLMVVSDYLSELAEILLNKILRMAWQELATKHGQPTSAIHKNGRPDFIIVAYGKLGGLELGYQSDLDIIFLHDADDNGNTDGEATIGNGEFFLKLAQRIIFYLTNPTSTGVLYDVDMRLRPSGTAGLLVSSFERFKNYQTNDAWIWEHQALIRARAITGSQTLTNAFNQFRREILTRKRSLPHLRQEIIKMREKMSRQHIKFQTPTEQLKHGPGGVIDIEFLVQYLVLSHAHHEPLLVRFTDNIRQLAALEALGRLSSWEAMILRDTYREIRKIQHYAHLSEKKAIPLSEVLVDKMKIIKEIYNKVFGLNPKN